MYACDTAETFAIRNMAALRADQRSQILSINSHAERLYSVKPHPRVDASADVSKQQQRAHD